MPFAAADGATRLSAEQAKAILDKQLALDPSNAEAWEYMAYVRRDLGDDAGSAEALEKSRSIPLELQQISMSQNPDKTWNIEATFVNRLEAQVSSQQIRFSLLSTSGEVLETKEVTVPAQSLAPGEGESITIEFAEPAENRRRHRGDDDGLCVNHLTHDAARRVGDPDVADRRLRRPVGGHRRVAAARLVVRLRGGLAPDLHLGADHHDAGHRPADPAHRGAGHRGDQGRAPGHPPGASGPARRASALEAGGDMLTTSLLTLQDLEALAIPDAASAELIRQRLRAHGLHLCARAGDRLAAAGGFTAVCCMLNTHIKERPDKSSGTTRRVTSDDEAKLMFRFADSSLTKDTTGTALLSVVESGSYENRIEIYGSTGALMVGETGELWHSPAGSGTWKPVKVHQDPVAPGMRPASWSRGFAAFSCEIVEALREGRTTFVIAHPKSFANVSNSCGFPGGISGNRLARSWRSCLAINRSAPRCGFCA